MRITPAFVALALGLSPALTPAQQRTPPDSVRADSARQLEAVRVSVARVADDALRLPWALSVQTADDLRRGRQTVSIDEALNNIPGVFVSNRYNFALDQVRVSMRGAGARANFGARGIKVLLDGVPQTLPDGQSQMTNVELGSVGRVEVLRGAASSLYGNASGGVISFETDMRAPNRLQQELRASSGSYGLAKWLFRTAGRTDRAVGMVSVSQTTAEGFRQYSEAEVRQINGGLNYAIDPSTTLEVRLNIADLPKSLNPGALTEAEWLANPDTAVATNVLRGALKTVTQQQVSVGLRRDAGSMFSWRAVAFYGTRSLDNPLAAQPPPPRLPSTGTRVTIERDFTGARFDLGARFGSGDRPAQFTAGVDLQRFSDERRNQRTTLGIITALNDTVFIHQVETVLGVGPFAQLTWSPLPSSTISAGVRFDRHSFKATDKHLSDGFDDSGERTMSAPSWHIGTSIAAHPMFVPYANAATSFETPTTTELQVQPSGVGGFNEDLDPQTTRSVEAGIRGASRAFQYELVAFSTLTEEALIQYAAENDRAYFRNAGSLRSIGAEAGFVARPSPWFEGRLAYTWAKYEFDRYRIPGGSEETVLDGKAVAGVPEHLVRAGFTLRGGALVLDTDWNWSGAVWGNDLNTTRIDDWGSGRLDLRLSWETLSSGQRFSPFVGVGNALDEVYVGSVTLNAFGDRYRESAPRRNWYAGFELGWSVVQ